MILGIDPGLGTCGWAVVDATAHVIELGLLESAPDGDLDEAVDRARRELAQVDALAAVAQRYDVRAICAEAMSFGGPPSARFAMAVSLGLSWGGICGLVSTLGVGLYCVPPKRWQHEVQPEAGKKIDYAALERAMDDFIRGPAREQLHALAARKRNHPIDAAAIGLFGALKPLEVDVIRAPRKGQA